MSGLLEWTIAAGAFEAGLVVDFFVGFDFLHGVDGLFAHATLFAVVLLIGGVSVGLSVRRGGRRGQQTIGGRIRAVLFFGAKRDGRVRGRWRRWCRELFGHIGHFRTGRFHFGRLFFERQKFILQLFGHARRRYDLLFRVDRIHIALQRLRFKSENKLK